MPAIIESQNLFQISSEFAHESNSETKFRTPEKNKTKPCNYGPGKKKSRTYSDEHLAEVKTKLFTATKLIFWRPDQLVIMHFFYLFFFQFFYKRFTSMGQKNAISITQNIQEPLSVKALLMKKTTKLATIKATRLFLRRNGKISETLKNKRENCNIFWIYVAVYNFGKIILFDSIR